MWALGDYPALAADLVSELGQALTLACGVRRGDRVLDVAAGSGNAAIAAARAGASVVACDLTPELLAMRQAPRRHRRSGPPPLAVREYGPHMIVCTRQSNPFDAVSHGRIDIARLRRSLAGLPLPRAADGRLMLAVHVSNWLRPGAATSPERLFRHVCGRGKARC
jgi:SAM-dependent methyltransferase